MKLDAICHPSWAASWVRALGLTGLCLPPPHTQSYPPSTLTPSSFSAFLCSSNGLGNCFGCAWSVLCSSVCVFIGREVGEWDGGGTQWSEHIGHCRESRQEQLVSWREGWEGGRDKEGKRWEAVRYTDNGIRLKHSEGERERPLLLVAPQIMHKLSTTLSKPMPASAQSSPANSKQGHFSRELAPNFTPYSILTKQWHTHTHITKKKKTRGV